MDGQLERAVVELAELRAYQADAPGSVKGPCLSGLACRFGVELPIRPGMVEMFAPGSIALGPRERDVKLLVGHNGGLPLANTKHGSLKLRLDQAGLRFYATLGDSTTARDAYEAVSRGDLSGASVGFRIKPDGERWTEQAGAARRELLAIELFEISLTALPVDALTAVEAHALDVGRRLLARHAEHEEQIARARRRLDRALIWSRTAEALRLPRLDRDGDVIRHPFTTEKY
jgi:HK97 family phage prohead protease